jgi:5-methylcytosine-specific restriction endonuclease McrA
MSWAEKVRTRDQHICQICGEPGTDAHHILCVGYFWDLHSDIENGITLCRKCHVLAHRGKFGAVNKGKYSAEQTEQKLMDRAGGNPAVKPLVMRLIESDIRAEATALEERAKRPYR